MAKTYPTKWFSSEMQGANQIIEDADGILIQTLKSVLVTGFGDLTAESLTYDAEKGLAKLSFSNGHAYLKDSVIEVSGSNVESFNGEKYVVIATTNDVYFDAEGETIDSIGAVGVRYPSLGWTISHESEDGAKAIFTPKGDLGEVHLRVDNSTEVDGYKKSYFWTAQVNMVSEVADIDTYTLECDSNYDHWLSTSATPKDSNPWYIVGDEKFFHYLTELFRPRLVSFYAGYIDSYKNGDRYHFVTETPLDKNSNYYATAAFYYALDGAANGTRAIARGHDQLVGYNNISFLGLLPSADNAHDYTIGANVTDNSFRIVENPLLVVENTIGSTTNFNAGMALRGTLPIYRDVITNILSFNGLVIDVEGRKYLFLTISQSNSSSIGDSYRRLAAFDITPLEV